MFSQTLSYPSKNIKCSNFAVATSLRMNTVNIPFEREVVSEDYLNKLDAIKEEMLDGEFFSLEDVDYFD